jgi:hypothetical protein
MCRIGPVRRNRDHRAGTATGGERWDLFKVRKQGKRSSQKNGAVSPEVFQVAQRLV